MNDMYTKQIESDCYDMYPQGEADEDDTYTADKADYYDMYRQSDADEYGTYTANKADCYDMYKQSEAGIRHLHS